MHLRGLRIKNFRALEDVEVEFSNGINIIVGPNAIGKTTILEAIRMAKGLVASRSQNEANPRGEQAIQLGHQDAAQQLEAHNSQPQLKYQRLKNTVFSAIVSSADARASLEKEFNTIFNGVLKGKKFVGPSVNEYGQLTTIVCDIESGRPRTPRSRPRPNFSQSGNISNPRSVSVVEIA